MSVVASPSQGAGLNRGAVHANFWRAHLSEIDMSTAKFGHAFEKIESDVGDVETIAYWEAPGEARIWPDNQARSYQGMKSQSFTVATRKWQDAIEWNISTKENDRTRTLKQVAAEKGKTFGRIPRRVFFQILLGSTDTDLLPAVPNAPDGAAFASATDGDGNDRFQLSGGNVETGGGVATVAAIKTDFYQAISRFPRFKNSGGVFVFDESAFDGGFIIYFNPANMEVFADCFKGNLIPSIAGTASQSNTITQMYSVELRPSPEITDNDWYVFLRQVPEGKKPMVWTGARPVTETPFGKDTGSDRARDYDVEGYAWDSRWGFGVGLPWACVKVNN